MSDSISAETLDRFRVRELVERYCDGITHRNWAQVKSVYAEEARWEELPPVALKFNGRDEILDGVSYSIEKMRLLVFMVHSCVAEIDGDRARARSVIHEFGYLDEREESRIEMYGVYHDELIRRDGNWQFINRLFKPIWYQLPTGLLEEISR